MRQDTEKGNTDEAGEQTNRISHHIPASEAQRLRE
jgi:hypothetical protein